MYNYTFHGFPTLPQICNRSCNAHRDKREPSAACAVHEHDGLCSKSYGNYLDVQQRDGFSFLPVILYENCTEHIQSGLDSRNSLAVLNEASLAISFPSQVHLQWVNHQDFLMQDYPQMHY